MKAYFLFMYAVSDPSGLFLWPYFTVAIVIPMHEECRIFGKQEDMV